MAYSPIGSLTIIGDSFIVGEDLETKSVEKAERAYISYGRKGKKQKKADRPICDPGSYSRFGSICYGEAE